MSLSAAIGQAQAIDGREAGSQATRQALAQAGRNPVVMGILIASSSLSLHQVLSGARALLADVPLLGFSTTFAIGIEGLHRNSAVVVLLTGSDVDCRTEFQADYSKDSRSATRKIIQSLQPDPSEGIFLFVMDGFGGDPEELCAELPAGKSTLAGWLAAGELKRARTYQMGGRQTGHGGLAAAYLNGKILVGTGISHGWEPIGTFFKVTRVDDLWVRSLNDQPAAEALAEWFGHQAREWVYPPLNELVRLYPLGIERGNELPLLIRSPLRVEADGSLRMHSRIPEGSISHLMVGSIETCLKAAEQAAVQAIYSLGNARPILALVLPDISWQIMMQAQPGAEIDTIRKVLGPNVPIAGGYTLGQIARLGWMTTPESQPELYNQSIEIILFGET